MPTPSSKRLCKDCGEEMQLGDCPQSIFSIKIPFVRFTFEIWDWEHKEYFCTCRENRHQERIYDDIADNVGQKAYEEGFRDGRNQP